MGRYSNRLVISIGALIMNKKFRRKKCQKNLQFKKKNHIDPMKSIMCTVLAVLFTIANSCMWIGIKGSFVWFIVLGAVSVALCIFLAVFKCIKAFCGFQKVSRRKEFY